MKTRSRKDKKSYKAGGALYFHLPLCSPARFLFFNGKMLLFVTLNVCLGAIDELKASVTFSGAR